MGATKQWQRPLGTRCGDRGFQYSRIRGAGRRGERSAASCPCHRHRLSSRPRPRSLLDLGKMITASGCAFTSTPYSLDRRHVALALNTAHANFSNKLISSYAFLEQALNKWERRRLLCHFLAPLIACCSGVATC